MHGLDTRRGGPGGRIAKGAGWHPAGRDRRHWLGAEPCHPDVIHDDNVERLDTNLFLQGANIPATTTAEARLYDKSILYVPDFIANAGGVICAAMEYHGANEGAAMAIIKEKVMRNTRQVLERTKAEGIPPRQAAEALALERVRKAMSFRRFNTFSMGPQYI